MGPGGRHGRLQQDGPPKLSVDTVPGQPAVQGGCNHGRKSRGGGGGGSWTEPARLLCCYPPGERHVPGRPVRPQVRRPSGHRGQLQVQKQREVPHPGLLLQGQSSRLVPPPTTTVMMATSSHGNQIQSALKSLYHCNSHTQRKRGRDLTHTHKHRQRGPGGAVLRPEA